MAEPELESFLSNYPGEIRELFYTARSFVLSVMPNALEVVDPPSKIVAYGYGRKYADLICAIAPYTRYVNLIFSNGVKLPDPEHLLQGTGKRARHIKITQPAELQSHAARALLEAAHQMALGKSE